MEMKAYGHLHTHVYGHVATRYGMRIVQQRIVHTYIWWHQCTVIKKINASLRTRYVVEADVDETET